MDHAIDTRLSGLGLIDEATAKLPEGMMRADEVNSFDDVLDGLSQTMWICEDAGRPKRYDPWQREGGSRVPGAAWADSENEFITHGTTRDGSTSPGPCAVNCSNNNEIYAFHPAGAHCLFGDGAVRLIAETIDIRIVGRMITRAAREPGAFPP